MIIDSHLHVWDLDRCTYPWLDEGAAPINRTITFEEIEPTLVKHSVGGVVLVQSADDDADTQYLLEVAAEHPRVVGVVAYAPLDDPEALATRLENYLLDPLIVGVRALIHDHPLSWTDRPVVEESFRMLAEARLPLDVPTTGPQGLAPVVGWLDRHPELRVVIDHLGKPPVGGDAAALGEWRALLTAVAQHPLATAKLSGLYAGSGLLDSWSNDGVARVAHEAIDLFGPSRVLAGGDWPIAVLAGGYDRVRSAIDSVVAGLSIPDRDAVLGLSAIATYSLDPQRLESARALDHTSITSEETP